MMTNTETDAFELWPSIARSRVTRDGIVFWGITCGFRGLFSRVGMGGRAGEAQRGVREVP